jgi:hypothetical protein
MTLADTEKTVSEIRDAPGALVLHSLTNDLKESAPTCCSPMKNIITNIQESRMTVVLDVPMSNISGLFCGVFDSLMSRLLYCTCDQIPAFSRV